MIDSPIKSFTNYYLKPAIEKQFYGRILEYMDYILPVLLSGKHRQPLQTHVELISVLNPLCFLK